ncbi:MAG: hypothetical protein NVS1B4_03120 [Gemmatimonadaceae bacterium]
MNLESIIGRFVRRVPAPPVATGPEPGYVELRAENARVVVVPLRGGLITSLVLGGREWLTGGGFAEYLPTIVGGAVDVSGRVAHLVDGGELADRRPEVLVEAGDSGTRVTTRWAPTSWGLRLERTLSLTAADGADIHYRLTNVGTERTPFLWASLARMPLGAATRISLAEAAPLRVLAQERVDLGGRAAHHWWPRCRIVDAEAIDLSQPGGNARRYGCRVVASLTGGGAAVEDDGVRLDLHFSADDLPNFIVEVNKGAWPVGRRDAPSEMRLGPSIGLPDSLADAVTAWNGAHWLEPEETRRWSVRWTARAIERAAPAG